VSQELKQWCYACDVPLLDSRVEDHHFPIPQRSLSVDVAGQTIPLCVACHDLVDRIPLARWPDEWWLEAMEAMKSRPQKLFVLKTLSKLWPDCRNRDESGYQG